MIDYSRFYLHGKADMTLAERNVDKNRPTTVHGKVNLPKLGRENFS